jgi:hypothetical protein
MNREELQKILVYDKQHYFSKFLKLQFKNINFQKVKNEENFYDPTKYMAIVFVLYSEPEVFDFLNVRINGKQVLVCTYNTKILNKMKKFNNITLVDTSKTKIEMIKEVRKFFEQFELVYTN